MCGIAGILDFKNVLLKDQLVSNTKLMTQQMRHRGPDDDGLWVSEHNHVCFGHRRLSIIDLSQNSSQPLLDSTKRYTITFNGEIYNYLDLKTELQKLNYSFQTNSDTEVLLNAYIEWGANCLKKFDGMFAFAIYDSLEKKFLRLETPSVKNPSITQMQIDVLHLLPNFLH